MMTEEEQIRWYETFRMEEKYPRNMYVMENAIRIRKEILDELERRKYASD